MKIVPFKSSPKVSLGVELEYQIIDPVSFDLIARAKDLIRNISESSFANRITPEITQSMIEVNSAIHYSPKEMYTEFYALQSFLLEHAQKLGIRICGGGTHPFQKWSMRKIFPSARYKNLSRQYKYLSKRSTVFGQHIHVGCKSGEDALYLTHALTRYVPQFIAITASSPFYQGIDTGYHSARSTVFNSFPLSGAIPYFKSWEEFSTYYYKMKKLKIVESMKDFYWDIRPKPEFGTVEVRICDVPLTFKKAILIAAYVQTIAQYLLAERPIALTNDLYYLYSFNRFQASRYGFEGDFVHPVSLDRSEIGEDILQTIHTVERYADQLNNMEFLSKIKEDVIQKQNDAVLLRQIYKEVGTFPQVVRKQCEIWASN